MPIEGTFRALHDAVRLLFLSVFVILIMGCEDRPSIAFAQKTKPELFSLRASPAITPRLLESVPRDASVYVSLNPQALSLPLGQVFSLSVSATQSFDVIFDRRSVSSNSDVVLDGYLRAFGPSYRVNLTVGTNSVFGRIQTPGGNLQVNSSGNSSWIFDPARAGLSPLSNVNDMRVQKNNALSSQSVSPRSIRPRNQHLTYIDVMVAVSSTMEQNYPGAVDTRVNSLINLANSALADSQIDMRFRLVHIESVVYDDALSNDAALAALTNLNGSFQQIESIRNQVGADLVTFVRPFVADGSQSCGVAWLNGSDGTALSDSLVYSVVADGRDGRFFCDDLTLAHELGHSLGSSHDVVNAEGVGIFPYSYGYGRPGVFGTVMSYLTPQSGRYSNPNINTCFNNPCGIIDQADNARSMNMTRDTVAAFRVATPIVSSIPAVITQAASAMTAVTANLNASVEPGGLETEVFFEYGTSSARYTEQTVSQLVNANVNLQDVSEIISGLLCDQLYFYRAVARNADGSVQGNEQTFSTLPCTAPQPLVETMAASNISEIAAQLNGLLTPNGVATNYFFEYGTTQSYGILTPTLSAGSGISPVEVVQTVPSLQCGTTYYFRLVGEAGGVQVAGSEMAFNTLPCVSSVPLLTNLSAVAGASSAVVSVDVDPSGQETNVVIEYGVNQSLDLVTAQKLLLATDPVSSLSFNLSSLACATTYDYRARAVIANGNVATDTLTFTTQACSSGLSIQTEKVIGVGQTGVTLLATLAPQNQTREVHFEYGEINVSENKTVAESYFSLDKSLAIRKFVSGLKCGTAYQYRAASVVNGVSQYGDTLTFVTNACVIANAAVTTLDPIEVSADRATFMAKVDPDGEATRVYFEYGADAQNFSDETPRYSIGQGNLSRDVSWTISGLSCGSLYYYRVVAQHINAADQLHYGEAVAFTTDRCQPVQIGDVSVWVNNRSASITVYLASNGVPSDVYLNYGDSSAMAEKTETFVVATGSVTIQLSSLKCNTQYFFNVVASNINGGVEGDQNIFSTKACELPPSVTTEPVLEVTATSVTLVARVNPSGGRTSVYFEYGSGDALGAVTQASVTGSGFNDQFVEHTVEGLSCETRYQYRSQASSAFGAAQGELLEFTTASCSSVPAPLQNTDTEIAAGTAHAIGISFGGGIIAWGDNEYGQLGADDSTAARFVGIKDELGETVNNAVKLVAGSYHSLALLNTGAVLAWGDNSRGQLGIGAAQSQATPLPVSNASQGALFNVMDIAAGEGHSVAVMNDGTVRAWGNNRLGQLGDGEKVSSNTPVVVAGVANSKAVVAGQNHTLVLTENGEILAWGDNAFGQLGDGSNASRLQAVKVLLAVPVVKIFAGGNQSFALDQSGQLWAWGDNRFAQLGLNDRDSRNMPAAVDLSGFQISEVKSIASGLGHSLLLTETGQVYAWGDNSYGQSAAKDSSVQSQPLSVVNAGGEVVSNVVAIAAGDLYSVALLASGSVLTWGDNRKQQLGASPVIGNMSATPVSLSDERGSPLSLRLPRIIVSTARLKITEGDTGAFTVRLSAPPTEAQLTLSVSIDSGDSDIVIQSGGELLFTTDNWDEPQQVRVSALRDADTLNGTAVIVLSAGGFASQRINIVEDDRNSVRRITGVGNLDAVILTGFVLLLLYRASLLRRRINLRLESL